MHFTKFQIKNFKGISDATLNFEPAGQNIFTLIGLNESGKTTVLEALEAFSIVKQDTSVLYSLNGVKKIDPRSYVPKNVKSNFTGNILFTAQVRFDDGEKIQLIDEIEKETKSKIDPSSIPDIVQIERGFGFENSDLKRRIYTYFVELKYRSPRGTVLKSAKDADPVWKSFTSKIEAIVPHIVYFPTFLFSQPEKIILNPTEDDESAVNRMYRKIIESLAKSLNNPLNIQKHIVDRIIAAETDAGTPGSSFASNSEKRQQIEASLNDMSAHLTETIFDSWKKIFGGNFSDRDIVLKAAAEKVAEGQPLQISLQFSIKDGKSNYDISERSLGFRWFFSFLLFTYYRLTPDQQNVLLLLDEPASNLHARAQMQLLESLPKIARGKNQIVYSTHSHYLINPAWLDQAFIVSNKGIDYEHPDESVRSDRVTSIDVEKYRNFVGKNADRVTYFQPVLDKLDVLPSKLDLVRSSVLVEGKSDFLIIEYARKILIGSKSSTAIVPTRGATGMDELIGLFMGWGVPFVICLDDDQAGRTARTVYIKDWGINPNQVITLASIDASLTKKDISGFLELEDLDLISQYFGISEKPSKSQIQLFFSEHFATSKKVGLSKNFIQRVKSFDTVTDQIIKSIYGASAVKVTKGK